MLSSFVISQILVGAAVVCNLLSFQFKQRTVVLILLIGSTIFVAGQLFFLEQISAMYLTLYAVVYWLVAIRTTDRRVMWFFIVIGILIFLLTYSSYLDFIVITATIVTLFSLYTPNQKQMRELQMLGSLVRTPFYILVFSPVGILLEATLLVSNIVGYYRFYIRKQSQ